MRKLRRIAKPPLTSSNIDRADSTIASITLADTTPPPEETDSFRAIALSTIRAVLGLTILLAISRRDRKQNALETGPP